MKVHYSDFFVGCAFCSELKYFRCPSISRYYPQGFLYQPVPKNIWNIPVITTKLAPSLDFPEIYMFNKHSRSSEFFRTYKVDSSHYNNTQRFLFLVSKSQAPNRCFQKWWYLQIIQFNRDFHYTSSILGYPDFWKHPNIPRGFPPRFSGTAMSWCLTSFPNRGFRLPPLPSVPAVPDGALAVPAREVTRDGSGLGLASEVSLETLGRKIHRHFFCLYTGGWGAGWVQGW